MNRKKITFITLLAIMLLWMIPLAASAAEPTVKYSGTCGITGFNSDVTWTLYSDGKFVVSGNNYMQEYGSNASMPWYNYKSEITEVVIEEGVLSVGNYSFYNCTYLKTVTLPESLSKIGKFAFQDCSYLKTINYNAKTVSDIGSQAPVFENAGKSGDGISIIFGNSVENIPAMLFYASSMSKPKVVNVTMGSNVKKIGGSAFTGLSGLKTITIPQSVTSIGTQAFNQCQGLTTIYYNATAATVTGSTNPVFYKAGNTAGCKVVMADNVTSIPKNLFAKSWITEVTIGKNVASIGAKAFSECTYLRAIYYNATAATVVPDGSDYQVFGGAGYVYSGGCKVKINSSLTSIPQYLFDYSNIKYLIIGKNVTAIGDNAFNECGSLTHVYYEGLATDWNDIAIGDNNGALATASFVYDALDYGACGSSATYVLYNTQDHDGSLKLVISGLGTMTDYAYSEGVYAPWIDQIGYIQEVEIQEGITSVGANAFQEGDYLDSISLPESLESIGAGAFGGCSSMSFILLPPKLKSIGKDAFTGCQYCNYLHFGGTQEQWEDVTIDADNIDTENHLYFGKEVHILVYTETQAPTCTENGSGYYTCPNPDCDCSVSVEKTALGHDMVRHGYKDPTCTEGGWNTYYECSRCGQSDYEEKKLVPLGHDYVEHEAQAPTCTEEGWEAYRTCKRTGCNYTEKEEKKLPALGHDYVNHEAQAPTCTEPGWDAYQTCGRAGCKYTTYVEKPANGHEYGDWYTTKKATPDEPGEIRHDCKNCDHFETDETTWEIIDGGECATGVEWQQDSEGAVTVEGSGAMPDYSEEIPAPWHAGAEVIDTFVIGEGITGIGAASFEGLSNLETVTIPASVTNIGENAFNGCTGLQTVNYTGTITQWENMVIGTGNSSLTTVHIIYHYGSPHSYTHHAAQAATCTGIGWNAYDECPDCGYSEFEQAKIPAKGHNMTYYKAVAAGYTKEGNVAYYKCSNCGKCFKDAAGVTELTKWKIAKKTLAKPSLTAKKAGSKKIKLTWKKVTGASGYIIYRATSKKGKYKTVKTITKGSTVSFTNSKLKKGKTYYYKLRAYKTEGKKKAYSAYSAVKYAKAK